MSYQVIKLSNGEDIVCNLVEPTSSMNSSQLVITSPLKMDTITKETKRGMTETLALCKWVQPYSDEKSFIIQKNSVVIMTPASVGLSKYYEYVLNTMNDMSLIKIVPTKKELKTIEEEEMDLEEELVSSEDLQSILDNFSTKKTIH